MLFSSQIIDNYRSVINELTTCDFTPVIDYLKCLEFTRVNSGSSTGGSEFENKERVCMMACMCWRLWSDHDHQEAEKQFGGFKISMNIMNQAIVWKCACLCDQRKKSNQPGLSFSDILSKLLAWVFRLKVFGVFWERSVNPSLEGHSVFVDLIRYFLVP